MTKKQRREHKLANAIRFGVRTGGIDFNAHEKTLELAKNQTARGLVPRIAKRARAAPVMTRAV